MKQIILIRHAKVDIDYDTTIHAHKLQEWIGHYDKAPICEESQPSQELRDYVSSSDFVITSELQRAIDSTEVLGIEVNKIDDTFNEAKIPEIAIPYIKFKPKSWFVMLRVWSLFGFGDKNTSMQASKLRAEQATDKLIELSLKYEKITLVGHGGMNWLISKAFQKRGWVLEPNSSLANWGMMVLRLKESTA